MIHRGRPANRRTAALSEGTVVGAPDLEGAEPQDQSVRHG